MVQLLAALHPRVALAAGEALRRSLLSPWIGLARWQVRVAGCSFELLEERSWVEAIEDPERWDGMTGVDREGRYEAAFSQAFWDRAREARTVVDAGAARGLYTLLAVLADGPREIHAFEPNAARRFALRLNLLRVGGSKRIVIRNCFLGARDGHGAITLDRYCRETGIAPDLVKIDIEGAEIELLEGAREVCLWDRPTLLIEFHQRRLRGQSRDPARMLELLEEYGYRVWFNGHHGALEEGDRTADMEWRENAPNANLTAILAEHRNPSGTRRGTGRTGQ